MISREQWDQLTDDQKFLHLFRQTQWAEGALHNLAEAIDRIREQLPKPGEKEHRPHSGDVA